jgi:murein endopeptidase
MLMVLAKYVCRQSCSHDCKNQEKAKAGWGKEKQKAAWGKEKQGGKEKQKAQHRAFPRGPPPQYYPGSNLLNFAVRMGSGEPG